MDAKVSVDDLKLGSCGHGHYPERFVSWSDVGRVLTCEVRGKRFEICGDESFDEETGECEDWFWPEEIGDANHD